MIILLYLSVVLSAKPSTDAFMPGTSVVARTFAQFRDGNRLLAFAAQGRVLEVVRMQGDWVLTKSDIGWLHSSELIELKSADAYFKNRVAKSSSDAWALQSRVWIAVHEKKLDKAIVLMEMVISQSPKHAPHYAQRAYIHKLAGDLHSALDDVNTAIRLKPDAVYYAQRGRLYYENQQIEHALNDFKKAITDNPYAVDAYERLAWVWATRPEDAKGEYKRALEYAIFARMLIRFDDAEANRTVAAARAANGDFVGAREDINKALKLKSVLHNELQIDLKAYENQNPYWLRKPTHENNRTVPE